MDLRARPLTAFAVLAMALLASSCLIEEPRADPVAGTDVSPSAVRTTTSTAPRRDQVEAAAVADHLEIEIELESVRFAGRLWDPFLPPLEDGTAVTVGASLTIPASTDPVPTVVIVHGCGGPGSSERDWATELSEQAIATIVLDSFGGRGVGEVCSGTQTVNVADLVVDVYRAAEFIRVHPRLDGDRIAVVGFSFGGRTALWSALDRFQAAYGGVPLQAHVAFYPSTCFIRLEDEADVVGGPIRILHGTADDYTPIEPCLELVDRLDSAGVDAAVIPYSGAHHGFDNRSLAWGGLHYSAGVPSPRACRFVETDGVVLDPETGEVAGVGSPCVESGVHYAYDAAARRQAAQDLLAILDAAFG